MATLHPFSEGAKEPLSRCRSENLTERRRLAIRNKWQLFEKKVFMLTLMMRGSKKKEMISEEEYMLQGLLRPQQNLMALSEMAMLFHHQKQE